MPKFTFSSKPPVRSKLVEIPEWAINPENQEPIDVKFYVEELSATECQSFVGIVNQIKSENLLDSKGIELYADMLSRCLRTDEGERPSKEWLMGSSFATLKRVGDQALSLNGFGEGTGEKLEKN